MDSEDERGALPAIVKGAIRAAIAGVVAGRPVLGLAAPPVRVRVEPNGANTVVAVDTASSIGVGRLFVRCLRTQAADELAALVDPDLPDDAAVLLLPRDHSDAQAELLAGIRSLIRHASLTRDADRFVAEVLRSGPRTTARKLLASLQGSAATAERRRRIHARSLVDQLARSLADTDVAARVALIAGSGMGKSALAVRICHQLADTYRVVGWLSATDSASWRSSVALLAERLGLSSSEPEDLWHALGERRPALIVVDDAPEPSNLRSSPPWMPGVHVLVTSQSVRWRAEAEAIELEPLDVHDGVEFLLARTGAEDEKLAAAVTQRLGGFPLALEQAAAAVVDGLSLRGWLDRYGEEPASGVTALQQAWQVRIASLRANHVDALLLLRILTCAGPAPVPAELLVKLGADFDEPAVAVCEDTARRDAAVAQLRAQCLIRTGADEETFVVHPLLAETVRGDPDFDDANMALLVAAVAGQLLDAHDLNEADRWSRTMALVSAAVAACHLVFRAVQRDPQRLPRDTVQGLANHALWLPAAYLHERAAAQAAYKVYMLGCAMHGDRGAVAAAQDGDADVVDTFTDLKVTDVVPAERLGDVPAGEPRMSLARWLNEVASLLMDASLMDAEAYARRALSIVPRRVAAVAPSRTIPWPAKITIEILNNLGLILMLQEDYQAAAGMFDRAVRRLRSYPDGTKETKYAELLNDQALSLLDSGRPEPGRREFAAAADAARANSQGPEVVANITSNLALTERLTWRLRSAHRALRAGLDWELDRNAPQSTSVMIQQCNLGLVTYDLGATEEGYALVQGSWQTLAERLGPEDREAVIRRLALAQLQLARGDRAAANEAVLLDLRLSEAVYAGITPWPAVHRVRSAWLGAVGALPPKTARALASELENAFGTRTSYGGAARDFLAAWALADPAAIDRTDVESAAEAPRIYAHAMGKEHPRTLLATARLALLRWHATGGAHPLHSGVGRRLLKALDSLTVPGIDGFSEDLARHGQPAVDLSRPGWEAERILHLCADDVVDLDVSEQLCWQANAGRLAALARSSAAGKLLRAAAEGSAEHYGPLHLWTQLRAAAAAVADDDPDSLRTIVTSPIWI